MKLNTLPEAIALSPTGVAYAQWGDGEWVAIETRHEIRVAQSNLLTIDVRYLKPLTSYTEETRRKLMSRGWSAWGKKAPLEALAAAADDERIDYISPGHSQVRIPLAEFRRQMLIKALVPETTTLLVTWPYHDCTVFAFGDKVFYRNDGLEFWHPEKKQWLPSSRSTILEDACFLTMTTNSTT